MIIFCAIFEIVCMFVLCFEHCVEQEFEALLLPSLRAILENGFSIEEIKGTGTFSVSNMLQAGCSVEALHAAGYSYAVLKR